MQSKAKLSYYNGDLKRVLSAAAEAELNEKGIGAQEHRQQSAQCFTLATVFVAPDSAETTIPVPPTH